MTKYKILNSIFENIKVLIFAVLIAVFIRSLFFQPFYIPSSSMEPTLLIGDRIFVSKFSYGYSKHSFPFSPNLFKGRILNSYPKQGDLVVFKTPADNRTDYIKRLIGLPGDTIQFIEGEIFINDKKILRKKIPNSIKIRCGSINFETYSYKETLPNGISYTAAYKKKGTIKNTDLYKVPDGYFFFLGDNRDCSKDSRYLSSVGYVKNENLVGKAKLIFFSNDTIKSSMLAFWNLNKSFRFNRFFKRL